jgi:hypothetical protein
MSNNYRFRLVVGLGVALMAAAGSAPSAEAQVYVIESTSAAIKSGSKLADTDALDIPAGAVIRAVLPSGKTQTIRGPYQGTVADLAKGQPTNEGVAAWLKNILLTGGSTEATPGAVRSAAPAAARPRTGFSWVAVPATIDGSVCIQNGAALQIVRAPSPRTARVIVVDQANSQQGESQWEGNGESTAWPASVGPRPDGVYDIMVEGRPRRQVTLRVLDKLPAESDVLTELHRLGCKYQFESWVRERMAAGK